MQFNQSIWYQPKLTITSALLLPLSWLFSSVVAFRKWLYKKNILKSVKTSVPVIVVGNITVGGTGKTPLVRALARHLTEQGFTPGIVCRGVGGQRNLNPVLLSKKTTAKQVGDEAVLLARTTDCPVVACIDRVKAINLLKIHHPKCDVIISDDGMQHYRMQRDIEIAVVDATRQFGNRQLLPAGPLREPVARLTSVDYIVSNGGEMENAHSMQMQAVEWVSVKQPDMRKGMDAWQDVKVHALAGIGNPKRFFNLLGDLNYQADEHAFPDHYPYQRSDIYFNDNLPVLMTEKDAVKCLEFASDKHWYLDVAMQVDHAMLDDITKRLHEIKGCAA